MIYIATVHFQTNKWIWPQLKYLNKYIQPYELYACCNGVEPGILKNYGKCFSTKFRSTGGANHAENLNFLAKQILKVAKPDDILMFLDGDAFPISEAIVPQIELWLEHVPLAAIRHERGASPLIPHPAFCVTTVGFWKRLQGDWTPASWVMPGGTVVLEPGCKIFKRLTEQKIAWHSVRRTNMVNIDQTYFGVYGSVVYHHGAGFRPYWVPDFHAKTGAHTQYIATSAEIVEKMMERHDDFFRVFTEEKYLDELEAALKQRGFSLGG